MVESNFQKKDPRKYIQKIRQRKEKIWLLTIPAKIHHLLSRVLSGRIEG